MIAMPTIDVLNATRKKAGSRELATEVFEAPVNVPLMHQVVVAGMAKLRAGTHKVKTRGDVRGGGKKPWRQKGTGRARQGSIRAPQWAGGGVAHGPVVRDHDQRINKKMRRGALRSALTDAHVGGKLAVMLVSQLPEDQLNSWGWRLPFLASFLMIFVTLYFRLRVEESPVFEQLRERTGGRQAPDRRDVKRYPKSVLVGIGAHVATWR